MVPGGKESAARGGTAVTAIGVVVALALLGLVLATADVAEARDTGGTGKATAIQPRADCVAWVNRYGQAKGRCYVPRGQQVRLRADCILFPDLYSNWHGHKSYIQRFATRACPYGIRGPIWNTRAA